MDVKVERPNEVRQWVDAKKAIDTVKRIDEEKPKWLLRGSIIGLSTIVPNEVERSGILESPERRRVINVLANYQVRLNDLLDFRGAGRAGLGEIISEAATKEQEQKIELDRAINNISDGKLREKTRQLVSNSIEELVTVEEYARLNRHRMTFEQAEDYRNLVNAINETIDTALILGTEHFEGRLHTISKEHLSYKSIYEKYKWIFNGEYRNNAERALMIMHNVAMVAQIDDDWYDVNIDKLLNIPSMGIMAIEEKKEDVNKAKKFLKGIRLTYRDKAHEFGIGLVAERTFTEYIRRGKQISKFLLTNARYDSGSPRKALWSKLVNKYLGKREQLYITGDLDPLTSSSQ